MVVGGGVVVRGRLLLLEEEDPGGGTELELLDEAGGTLLELELGIFFKNYDLVLAAAKKFVST